jgi:predicted DNA-binding transcriptional regulator YafY
MKTRQGRETNTFGSPGLRLLQLYTLLGSSGRRYSLKRLAAVFRCSRQTILRMVEQLELMPGNQMESWMEEGERYFQVHPERAAPVVSFDPDSIRHLMLCRDIVRNLLPKPLQQEIRTTIGKASILVPDGDDAGFQLESIAEPMGKGTIDYTPFQGFLEDIQQAMQTKRFCRMKYRSRTESGPKTYSFTPDRLVAFHDALYVRGWVWPEGADTPEKGSVDLGPAVF